MDLPKPGLRRQLMEPFITTVSGTVVEFLNPKPHQIKILDIAWHLANTCRYGTHIKPWYSNAEHSILGAEQSSFLNVQRAFLIHDAAEYVFGDIPSPVGRLCPEYKRLINNFQDCLYLHFLGKSLNSFEEEQVKYIDGAICATEMRDLRRNPPEHLVCEPYPEGQVAFWNWDTEEAEFAFMKRFKELFPEYKDVE
jgi:hypothetical protein